jgi:hypothetical protein
VEVEDLFRAAQIPAGELGQKLEFPGSCGFAKVVLELLDLAE